MRDDKKCGIYLNKSQLDVDDVLIKLKIWLLNPGGKTEAHVSAQEKSSECKERYGWYSLTKLDDAFWEKFDAVLSNNTFSIGIEVSGAEKK
jgi:hypothetical protein